MRIRRLLAPVLAMIPFVAFACGSSSSSSSGSTSLDGAASGDGSPGSTVEKAWTGQKIDIRSDGADLTINGGISITADPNATSVSVTADIRPNTNDLDAAPGSTQPTATLTMDEEGGAIVVRCTKTSAATDGGCNKLTVVVPAGTTAKPLSLSVSNDGSGVTLSGRGTVLAALDIVSHGTVEATVSATKGATISIDARQADDVTLRLPTDFAADLITLTADADKIDTADFPDVQSGQGRGTAGTGAESITLKSTEFAGSTGAVVLKKD